MRKADFDIRRRGVELGANFPRKLQTAGFASSYECWGFVAADGCACCNDERGFVRKYAWTLSDWYACVYCANRVIQISYIERKQKRNIPSHRVFYTNSNIQWLLDPSQLAKL